MTAMARAAMVFAAVALIGAGSATAQRPQTRQGFWIAFGLGYGSTGLGCDGCSFDREGGGVGHIRLGGTLSQKLLLGGDVTVWTKDVEGVNFTVGNVSFIAQYYPMEMGGLFLKGGAGFSQIELSNAGESASGESFGLSAGVGYDIRVGRNISITPLFDFVFGASRDVQYQGSTLIPGLSFNSMTAGLGITFH
jgi:hypothetical protein